MNPKGVHILADAVDPGRTADKTLQALFGNVHRIDVESMGGEKTGIAPVSASEIKRATDPGMVVKFLHDPRGRCRKCFSRYLRFHLSRSDVMAVGATEMIAA